VSAFSNVVFSAEMLPNVVFSADMLPNVVFSAEMLSNIVFVLSSAELMEMRVGSWTEFP
jgi:hypothetical protein